MNDVIMEFLKEWGWIILVLLGVSESVAYIPWLESNSVLQIVINTLRKVKSFIFPSQLK